MARLSTGDRAAFDEVFRAVEPPARALALRLLSRSGSAPDDAVQEALIKIFERAHQYDPTRDALAWALAIVAWECKTIRKKQQRSREGGSLDSPDPADPAASPEAAVIDRELWAHVEGALGALSAEDRATIAAAWSGEDRGPVAPATFRKRLERAMGRLRGAWRATHGA